MVAEPTLTLERPQAPLAPAPLPPEIAGTQAPARTPGWAELSPQIRQTATLGGGFLAVAMLVHFGLGSQGFIAAGLAAVLAVLSAIDLEFKVLPNRIVLPAAGVALVAQTLLVEQSSEWLVAGGAAAAIALLPAVIKPGSLGMGDVKLALLLGFVLGWDVVSALMLGSLAAFPVALWILWTQGTGARKQAIPFGPFMAIGAVLALLLTTPT
jgi:leader peptidase (prepilin peptidase)/N-methyltransferase